MLCDNITDIFVKYMLQGLFPGIFHTQISVNNWKVKADPSRGPNTCGAFWRRFLHCIASSDQRWTFGKLTQETTF